MIVIYQINCQVIKSLYRPLFLYCRETFNTEQNRFSMVSLANSLMLTTKTWLLSSGLIKNGQLKIIFSNITAHSAVICFFIQVKNKVKYQCKVKMDNSKYDLVRSLLCNICGFNMPRNKQINFTLLVIVNYKQYFRRDPQTNDLSKINHCVCDSTPLP